MLGTIRVHLWFQKNRIPNTGNFELLEAFLSPHNVSVIQSRNMLGSLSAESICSYCCKYCHSASSLNILQLEENALVFTFEITIIITIITIISINVITN
jgi:hypothetical protein